MKILFIGSRLFDDVADYTHEQGVTSIVSESNPAAPNLDLADSFFILPRGMEAPMDLAISEDVDAVVPLIGVDGPLVEVARMKEKLEGDHGIPVVASGLKAALISTDKLKTKEFFTDNGIKTPRYIFVSAEGNNQELDALKRPRFKFETFPAVLKQRAGQGGSDISIVQNREDLADYLKKYDSTIIEEYIQGQEISVEVLRWRGKSFPLVAVDKGATRMDGMHPLKKIKRAPAAFEGFDQDQVLKTAVKIVETLGSEGNTDVDMIISREGEINAIEVNTRPSGTRYISTAATDVNPMHQLVNMAINRWSPEKLEKKNYYAIEAPVGVFRGENPGKVFRGDNSWIIHGPKNHQRITVRAKTQELAESIIEKFMVIR